MGNPRTTALISGIAALPLGYRVFFGSDGISPTLSLLQWALFGLALVGLIGSLVQMRKR